jgi:F0F1-type ATP synthase assembly protein I
MAQVIITVTAMTIEQIGQARHGLVSALWGGMIACVGTTVSAWWSFRRPGLSAQAALKSTWVGEQMKWLVTVIGMSLVYLLDQELKPLVFIVTYGATLSVYMLSLFWDR